MTKDWGQVCFSEIATESADAADKQVPLTSSNVVDEFHLTDCVTGMFITYELIAVWLLAVDSQTYQTSNVYTTYKKVKKWS